MNILKKYLNKLGVKEFSDLSPEEKETYRQWEESLNGRKITDDDVQTFFETQEEEVISKLIASDYKSRDDMFLKAKLDIIRRVKSFLKYPEVEKKILENNINNLLK